MKWSVGTKIGGGFGLALVILIILSSVAYWNITEIIAANELRTHIYEVIRHIDQVLGLLKDAETGQRGYLLTGDEHYLAPYNDAVPAIDREIESARQLTGGSGAQQQRIIGMKGEVVEKLNELKESIELRRTKGADAALQVVLTGKGKQTMDQIRETVAQMESDENDLMQKRTEIADERTARTIWTLILGTGLAIVILSVAGFRIIKDIARPLREITGAAERIALGDLGVKLTTDSRSDEVGALTRAFAAMSGNLSGVIGQIREAAEVMASSASEIMASSAQLASGATETATAVTQTTATIEEVKQTAEQSSRKGRSVAEKSQQMSQVAVAGRKSVEATADGMNRIREQMESIADSIVRLSEQSQSIGEIIASVDDLAAQSNLLAVNAAIEAAKAGEHGRGFAVVAQEVKSLADQSKQATTQVRGILNEIQKATTAAVLVTEQGTKAVEAGVNQSKSAGESIGTLAENVSQAADAATQIAATSQQQFVGMDQVASAMESIKLATTQVVSSTRQAEAAAQNLHGLGQKLTELVGRFKA